MWEYRAGLGIVSLKRDFVGYAVEGSDGRSIGRIHNTSRNAAGAYLVVDMGIRSFGKKRIIPAGLVERVDVAGQRVFVDLSKAELKAAPEYAGQHSLSTRRDGTAMKKRLAGR